MITCSSCQREIEWTVVAKSGKRMPIDPVPRDDGNLVKLDARDEETGAALVEYVMAGGGLFEDRDLYVSHFATCEHADRHRKRGK